MKEFSLNFQTDLVLSFPDIYSHVVAVYEDLSRELENNNSHAYFISFKTLEKYFQNNIYTNIFEFENPIFPTETLSNFRIMYLVALSLIKIQVEINCGAFNFNCFKRSLKQELLFLKIPEELRKIILDDLDLYYIERVES